MHKVERVERSVLFLKRDFVNRSKKIAVGIAAVLVTLMGASPAFAEGSFTSSLLGVLPGFNSRVWYKGSTDGASTKVSVSGCSVSGNTELELRRVRAWMPDESKGSKSVNCNSGTANWGSRAPSQYKFRVNHTPHDSYMTVRTVTVNY